MIWRHFWAWLYLTNTPKVSESKYQAGFGMIILGQNPLTFMIPIYSTTVLYDKEGDCWSLQSILSILNSDDVVMQVTALKVLATALGKGDKSLVYFYEEHHVSRLIMCLISLKFMIYYFIADGGSWGCMSASSSLKPTMDCSFSGWPCSRICDCAGAKKLRQSVISRDSHLFGLLNILLLEFRIPDGIIVDVLFFSRFHLRRTWQRPQICKLFDGYIWH